MNKWRPIETIPYDTNVLVLHESGNVRQDFLYDADYTWMAERGDTHWMPIPLVDEKECERCESRDAKLEDFIGRLEKATAIITGFVISHPDLSDLEDLFLRITERAKELR